MLAPCHLVLLFCFSQLRTPPRVFFRKVWPLTMPGRERRSHPLFFLSFERKRNRSRLARGLLLPLSAVLIKLQARPDLHLRAVPLFWPSCSPSRWGRLVSFWFVPCCCFSFFCMILAEPFISRSCLAALPCSPSCLSVVAPPPPPPYSLCCPLSLFSLLTATQQAGSGLSSGPTLADLNFFLCPLIVVSF